MQSCCSACSCVQGVNVGFTVIRLLVRNQPSNRRRRRQLHYVVHHPGKCRPGKCRVANVVKCVVDRPGKCRLANVVKHSSFMLSSVGLVR